MKLELNNGAFQSGEPIPAEYTCEGDNISPPLSWSAVPSEAKSLALICDDPDAPNGVWSHWVLYNIPPWLSELSEDIPAEATLSEGGVHGRNDFGNLGYDGPCPPLDSTHTYYFRLYALDMELNLPPGATRHQVYDHIQGHIIDSTELQGHYGRS